MHDELRKAANTAGYTEEAGNLVILGCGAQDFQIINSTVGGTENVDTIISILTLCSVPSPKETIHNLVHNVLKPGGTLLLYEHVKSPLKEVQFWQNFWTPIWSPFMDGCSLNRPTDKFVKQVSIWSLEEEWSQEGEDVFESLLWHSIGRYVKKSRNE